MDRGILTIWTDNPSLMTIFKHLRLILNCRTHFVNKHRNKLLYMPCLRYKSSQCDDKKHTLIKFDF